MTLAGWIVYPSTSCSILRISDRIWTATTFLHREMGSLTSGRCRCGGPAMLLAMTSHPSSSPGHTFVLAIGSRLCDGAARVSSPTPVPPMRSGIDRQSQRAYVAALSALIGRCQTRSEDNCSIARVKSSAAVSTRVKSQVGPLVGNSLVYREWSANCAWIYWINNSQVITLCFSYVCVFTDGIGLHVAYCW